MSRIFLSHSSSDNGQALALRQWLIEQRPDLTGEIFLDVHPVDGIRGGVRWKDALQQAIYRCEAVIFLVSQHWQESHECKAEYRVAEILGKYIVVARLGPVEGEDKTREWQRCDLFGHGLSVTVSVDGEGSVDFRAAGLQRLLAGLEPAGIGPETFAWPPTSQADRAPYRGWEPFDAADAAVFFGRDTQILAGRDRLTVMRTVGVGAALVVLGPSGAGKSSYLRAGLWPRLARDRRHFAVLDILRPAREAITGTTGLAAVIHSTRARFGLRQPSRGDIGKALIDGSHPVREWLSDIQQLATTRLSDAEAETPPTLILPIDQAEELFTADAGAEGPLLLDLLAALLDSSVDGGAPRLGVIAVVCMRTDRYEAWQTSPHLAGINTEVFDDLGPMPKTLFKDVITGPCSRLRSAGTPLEVEPELVDRLLTDCTDGADALPLLALTLSRLYRDYGDTGALTTEQYDAIGGVRHVVLREIDHILSSDQIERKSQLALLRSAFIPLLANINPANDQPLRRIAAWNELPADAHALLNRFVDRRLLVKSRQAGQTVVEVALESLLRLWDELAGWLREEAEDLKAADTLERNAQIWSDNRCEVGWLLATVPLLNAEALIAKPGYRQRLAPVRDFVIASRRSHDSRVDTELRATRARNRVLTVLLAVLAVFALLVGMALVTATRVTERANAQARQAIVTQLITEGEAILSGSQPGDDIHAFDKILAAHALQPSPQTDLAIVYALYARRQLQKVVRTGQPVAAVAFSPDGRYVVSGSDAPGSETGNLRLWNVATGQPVHRDFDGRIGPVVSVAFSPDGRFIASGGGDGTIRISDVATGRSVVPDMTGHAGPVFGVAFSPDGQRLASGGGDGTLRIWNAGTGAAVGSPLIATNTDAIWSVAFDPKDEHRLVSGSENGTLQIWDTVTGQPVCPPLTGHTAAVYSVAFSPDGKRIVSGSGDSTVRIWDAANGAPVGDALRGHSAAVKSVAFSPDGQRIVSGSQDRTLAVWDVANEHRIQVLAGHTDFVRSVAFSPVLPDEHRIVSGSSDGSLRTWDGSGIFLNNGARPFPTVAFCPDPRERSQFVSASEDGTLTLWDTRKGKLIEPVQGPFQNIKYRGIPGVAYSPDGRRIISVNAEGTLQLWDADTLRPIGAPETRNKGQTNYSVAFDPTDPNHFVSGNPDGTLTSWRIDPSGLVDTPFGSDRDTRYVNSVAFSRDGRWIVSAGGSHTPTLWNAHTLAPIATLTDNTGYLDQDYINYVAFDPHRVNRIVSGGGDGTLQLWDINTRQRLNNSLAGHNNAVTSEAFTPDGTLIVSGGSDNTVRIWDAGTYQPVGPALTGPDAPVGAIAISSDGLQIVSGNDDGTLRVWPIITPDPEYICAKLASNIGRGEWNTWVSPNIKYTRLCPDLPTDN